MDSRSSLHGDEQDLGRYPAYWKHSLLLTFRNGGGRALSAGWVLVGVGDGVWHRASWWYEVSNIMVIAGQVR